jgi:ABC-type microcin C transport system permease subunit YejB
MWPASRARACWTRCTSITCRPRARREYPRGSLSPSNALIPIITVVGTDFGSFLSGAVLTESIFAWPGLGRFTLDAILKRDIPAIQGAVFFMAVVFMVVNLIVDLSYAWVDPRVKVGRAVGEN